MGEQNFDVTAMRETARFEVDQYHKSNARNSKISRTLHNTISTNIDLRKGYAEKRIREAEEKKRVLGEKKSEIYERYSHSDIQKGKFSRIDAKALKEIQEEESRLNNNIKADTQELKNLENAGREVFAKVAELEQMGQDPLMFGYPVDPKFKSSSVSDLETKDHTDTQLDFTNADDRVRNYQYQYEWAKNLTVLAELLGPKIAKEIYSMVDSHINNTTRQSSSAIDAKQEEISALLSQHGFGHLHTDEFRPDREGNTRLEDNPTVDMAVSTISKNSRDVLRIATRNITHTFLDWPEEDKRALKVKSKEPDYANQVCRAIDNVINSIGGIQGMDAPAEVIAKLEKLKAPYAKMVSKQKPEQRKQFEQTLDTKEQQDIKITEELTTEPIKEEVVSPEARYYFDLWRQSHTGREFFDWCVEEKHLTSEELHKITGIDQLFKEWDEGVKQYHEQQEQKEQLAETESLVGRIDPTAYAYYDAYSKSGSPLGFEKWCDEKGLEIPKGWQLLQQERVKGINEYQEQQNKQAEILNPNVIDPTAYAYYDAYSKSGSPLGFEKWCDEKGLEIPRGWQMVQQERVKGYNQYLEQQQQEDDLEMGE